MKYTTKQLRSCNAKVTTCENLSPITMSWFDCIGQHHTAKVNNYHILTSYHSNVAVYDLDNEILYLMPRWDYSATTHKHVHKFIVDYVPWLKHRYNARDVRREAIAGVQLVDGIQDSNGDVYRY